MEPRPSSALVNSSPMVRMSTKKTRLTFRFRSELKKKLELVAASESRSVAQICEAFLQAVVLLHTTRKELNTLVASFRFVTPHCGIVKHCVRGSGQMIIAHYDKGVLKINLA